MKRFHVHVAVDNLPENIRFYSAIFGNQPSIVKDDYAKWMLDDPRINFAISTRGDRTGINHLGIQVETAAELKELSVQLTAAQAPMLEQTNAECCYAKSDKYWITDPQEIAWETYHTMDSIPLFGGDSTNARESQQGAKSSACCVPQAQ